MNEYDLEQFIKGWDELDKQDQIKELVFHKDISDRQKIIALKMLLGDEKHGYNVD